ncbi:MAG: peptidoglycan DD-metalloendopeptidase family protein [Patescibacteria group bacterium]|nr:peptidoglycan DD-metalloendopeptidase family protein [Patescibacteria group bacterium]
MNKTHKNTIGYVLAIFIVIAIGVVLGTKLTQAETTNSNENTNNGPITNQPANTNDQPAGESQPNNETTPTDDEADKQALEKDVLDLNLQIEERKKQLEALQAEHETYRKNLAIKQQEALTLSSQVSSLEDQLKETEVEVQITETEIDTLRLQIREVKNKIDEREDQINDQKTRLAQLIRKLNTYQNKNLLEILIKENKFSKFFNQLNYLEETEGYIKKSLDEVKVLKQQLEGVQTDLESKETELEEKKNSLKAEKEELEGQKTYKDQLLTDTKESEAQYQELLEAVKSEQVSVNSEIGLIEDTIRQKLEGEDLLSADTNATLSWPVSPLGGITAYFHDPTYIFRRLFEHPAIDIRAKQGTPVKAAASGYVARAKDAGLGYSYVMIIHANDISTVYGHLSSIDVEEESFVTRGQVIGNSGGMPGTPGAGRLTTGPHLHFEVRANGIPVNPIDYLP